MIAIMDPNAKEHGNIMSYEFLVDNPLVWEAFKRKIFGAYNSDNGSNITRLGKKGVKYTFPKEKTSYLFEGLMELKFIELPDQSVRYH